MKLLQTFIIAAAMAVAFGCTASEEGFLDPAVGPVHSGMTISQVEAKFGKPDETYDALCSYTNIGLTIYFSDKKLVHGFSFGSPFTGHTKEGIKIGSGRADVIKAYGEPTFTKDIRSEMESLIYKPLHIAFQIKSGKVDRIIVNFKTTK